MSAQSEVTRLLNAWSQGDEAAFEKLLPLVYDDLHQLAAGYLNREMPGHTLQPTALVNEAYLRLVNAGQAAWENRKHFFSFAARVMRNILVDHARRQHRAKRGGHARRLTLSQLMAMPARDDFDVDVIALDEALTRLAALDPQQSRIVECHYFAGLTVEEMAELFDVSASTVKREMRSARAWLLHEISR